MSEKPPSQLSQIANDTGKALTVQAGLTGVIGIIISRYSSLSATEVPMLSSFLSTIIVWGGRRLINRYDADETVLEPTRALVLLRDKTEQEVLSMDKSDPRRAQRMRQAEALTEEIFRRTVEIDFVPVLGHGGTPPFQLPKPQKPDQEEPPTR